MITSKELETLEEKLKDDNHCIIKANKDHKPLGKESIKIFSGELGEIVGYEPNTIKVKWSKSNISVNYFTQFFTPPPFEILKYIPKDHPAQKKLFD